MKKRAVLIAAAAMAFLPILGGAAMAADPPAGGTVSIEPKTTDGDYDPSLRIFVGAAADALASKGFTILEDPGHSAYVAELALSRTEVGTSTVKGSAGHVGPMPGGAGGSVGMGVVVPFATGNSRIVPLQRVRLELRIRKRGADEVVWNGAAVTVRPAGTKKGADETVATDLTQALLRGYPAIPEGVVGVP